MLKLRLVAYGLVLSSLAIMSPSALAQTSPSRGPAGTPNGNNPSGGGNTPISTPSAGGTGGAQSVPGATVTAPTAPGAPPTITFTPTISAAINTAANTAIATFVAPGSTPTQQTLGAFFTGNTAVVVITSQAVPGGITLVTLQNGVVTGTQVLPTFSQVFAQASNLIGALGTGALGTGAAGTGATGAGALGTGAAGTGATGAAGTGAAGTGAAGTGASGIGTAFSIQVGNTKVTIRSANGRAGRG